MKMYLGKATWFGAKNIWNFKSEGPTSLFIVIVYGSIQIINTLCTLISSCVSEQNHQQDSYKAYRNVSGAVSEMA